MREIIARRAAGSQCDVRRKDVRVTDRPANILSVGMAVLCSAMLVHAAAYPTPMHGDFVIQNFRFASGETLPALRVHYRTLGRPERDAQGLVRNTVLIMHGTGGSGAQFIREEFAGELFGE